MEVPGEWGTFQLDGYGTWLWALDQHLRRYDLSAEPFADAIGLTAAYLAAFADRPCFDWWEENPEHRHVSTIAAVIAGLEVAVGRPEVPAAIRERSAAVAADLRATVRQDAGRHGRLAKWIGSDSIDASLIAVSTPFGILAPDDPLMEATIAAVERDLVRDGAVHRYPGDSYYGGGGWPVLAGFLGWHRLRSGRPVDARVELDWIATLAAADGELPEQDRNRLLIPEAEAAWIDRWGPSARPLLWSHAMYLTLAAELGVIGPDGEAAGRTTSAD
jgi:GH15 family glucan-1,4-alpha-glucosidase